MPPNHVIIVGGGLAGPALAIALARHSVKSTILERHDSVQDIGGVIMLALNAMCVMDDTLGIADKLKAKGSTFDSINVSIERGDVLDPVGGFLQKASGRSAISLARPALHQALVDECESLKEHIDMRFSAKLQSITESSEGVVAVLEDGSEVKGDILIGADGIGSKVRHHILGKDIKPTYSGILVVGAVLPRSQVSFPPSMQLPAFFYTRHGTFLSFANDDQTLQWATSLKTPERDRKTGWEEYEKSGQAVADLKERYSDMQQEPIKSLVDSLTNEDVRLWAPYLMPDIEKWHTDRICLIGDAAHAIPPSVGQGAAQAFEDIGLLSRLLLRDDTPDYPSVFAQFEALRRPRIDKIRELTASAEATRRETASPWLWWLKGLGTKAAFWVGGDNGFLKNDDLVEYDVTKVDI